MHYSYSNAGSSASQAHETGVWRTYYRQLLRENPRSNKPEVSTDSRNTYNSYVTFLYFRILYKGPAPRAADAARCACARKSSPNKCEGGRKKRPMI